MSDFKAKMHQIRFRLGLRPRPRWGAYSAPPDALAGFKGAYFKRQGRKGRREEGEEWEWDSFGPRSGPPTFLRIYAHEDREHIKNKRRNTRIHVLRTV